MRILIALAITILLLVSACETPIDAKPQEQANDTQPETPHIEEVVKNETEPVSPTTPIPDSAPLPPPPAPTPAPEPAPTPPPAPEAPKPATPPPAPKPVEKEEDESSLLSPTQPEKTLTDPLNDEAKKLITRADEKVKSYDFVYAPPPDNLARDKFLIKGTRMKIQLYDRGWFDPNTHMTAVYIDAKTKTASGYCEDNRLTHCPDPNRRFPIAYDQYAIKTPYQWLKEISFGRLDTGEKIFDRVTQKISYAKGNTITEQWIDTFSGLPVRVRVTDTDSSDTFEFRDLNVNSVTDDAFVHSAS